jgi:hypothetical protein
MNFLYEYLLNSGEIIVKSTATNEEVWRGKPFGINTELIVLIPGTTDAIIMLNSIEAQDCKQKNLLRVNPHGQIAWVVGDPEKDKGVFLLRNKVDFDTYTDVTSMKNNILVAYAWSGFSDEIDLDTGAVLRSKFVK